MLESLIHSNSQNILTSHSMLILQIQTEALKAIHDYLYEQNLIQLMPVMLSPITDPLSHETSDAKITYFGQELQLTKSMIFHKQLAIASSNTKGIYIMSPNIRLEKYDKRDSGRHLIEFSQVDIELREVNSLKFMELIEGLIISVINRVKEKCKIGLENLGVSLRIPARPFKIYSSEELKKKLGENFEKESSLREIDPFWITDYYREFYDKEDPKRPGHYLNYDLIYPEGFNEALSGGERDFEYKILLRKIKERHQNPEIFEFYLDEAKEGKLVASAGGGLGIERLVRFLTKIQHIRDVSPFSKVPGEHYQI
ncbi:asparagine synthetase A [Promethearchaeum syntrophicum]|uniref:Asparagine synthetase A n=1 Tax=Promethearchaeum syntrophicum TaxID=2594042 RepID=A0A5B9D815_9ARCH|nr:asparagine synthetase A [Candidatus Prometheoarchaeum syntrophicum]QEE15222.1 Asparagine--tRNA ligase [Candidatus Prometheoarchaeum syntrophicum]